MKKNSLLYTLVCMLGDFILFITELILLVLCCVIIIHSDVYSAFCYLQVPWPYAENSIQVNKHKTIN